MSETKGNRKQGSKKKGESAIFRKKIKYNSPLKYKTKANPGKGKVVKLMYHIDASGQMQQLQMSSKVKQWKQM